MKYFWSLSSVWTRNRETCSLQQDPFTPTVNKHKKKN